MPTDVSARHASGADQEPASTRTQQKAHALGLTSATGLVVGSIVGTGVFAMPAVLAQAGTSSIIVLGVIALGAMLLATMFGQLTKRIPNSDGGLYAYARHEFGDFAGYLTGWCYWIQAWAGNAAIVAVWVLYVDALFGIHPSGIGNWGIALTGLWIPSAVNPAGVKQMAWFQACALTASRGWELRQDGGRWRRVVPSPEPVELLDLPFIRMVLGSGAIAVCAGGGGVPVVKDGAGMLRGVEAVVDKDLTASLLARALDADALLLLTDVAAVQDEYGTAQARPIRRATPAQLRSRSFPAGSMGPKIEAVSRFVKATGKVAAIGQLADAQALLNGQAGTTITPRWTKWERTQ